MIQKLRCPIYLLLAASIWLPALAFDPQSAIVSESLVEYASVGLCHAEPREGHVFQCTGPSSKPTSFRAASFVAASELVLEVADDFRKKSISPSKIRNLVRDSEFAEFVANVRLNYANSYFSLGLIPKQYSGQFTLHNPNLPLASLVFRDDSKATVGVGAQFVEDNFQFAFGARTTSILRKELTAETTLAEIAAKRFNEISRTEKMLGSFTDVSAQVVVYDVALLGLSLKDLGGWEKDKAQYTNYLFIENDHAARFVLTTGFLPPLFFGKLWAGIQFLAFLSDNETQSSDDNWFASCSYFAGPLKLFSSFRNDFLRTGLSVRYEKYEVQVAQDWVQKRRSSDAVKPLLTIELGVNL